MRRWNGWGEEDVDYALRPDALAWLQEVLGPGRIPRDRTLEETLATVPPSDLPAAPWLSTDAETRLRHGAGQSFEDWVEIRGGRVPRWPDAVALPESPEAVREVLAYARRHGCRVLPYGGGTSVVGHLRLAAGGDARPVICCSLERMARLVELDETSRLATFEAGVAGPALEAALAARGYTLGHFPQSFELSTLGGWVATRSSGQFSRQYGRIEDLYAGGEIETPEGPLDLPPLPASAAGPDLRHLVLGSEGRLGVITRCRVRIAPRPRREDVRGAFFPHPEAALAAVREASQAGIPLAMMRLSLPAETATSLALAGGGVKQRLLGAWLALRRVGPERCLLLYAACGEPLPVVQRLAAAEAILRRHGAVLVGRAAGRSWQKSRFTYPYVRNTLWRLGYGADTLETAVPWSRLHGALTAIEGALRTAAGERPIHVFTHLSHVYPTGSSLYTSYVFPLAADPDETLAHWRRLKTAASQAIVAAGGTISHQHGVGRDHKAYLSAEKGELGLELLRAAIRRADPDGRMDVGNLVDTPVPEPPP